MARIKRDPKECIEHREKKYIFQVREKLQLNSSKKA